jgi:hypothetical protein
VRILDGIGRVKCLFFNTEVIQVDKSKDGNILYLTRSSHLSSIINPEARTTQFNKPEDRRNQWHWREFCIHCWLQERRVTTDYRRVFIAGSLLSTFRWSSDHAIYPCNERCQWGRSVFFRFTVSRLCPFWRFSFDSNTLSLALSSPLDLRSFCWRTRITRFPSEFHESSDFADTILVSALYDLPSHNVLKISREDALYCYLLQLVQFEYLSPDCISHFLMTIPDYVDRLLLGTCSLVDTASSCFSLRITYRSWFFAAEWQVCWWNHYISYWETRGTFHDISWISGRSGTLQITRKWSLSNCWNVANNAKIRALSKSDLSW